MSCFIYTIIPEICSIISHKHENYASLPPKYPGATETETETHRRHIQLFEIKHRSLNDVFVAKTTPEKHPVYSSSHQSSCSCLLITFSIRFLRNLATTRTSYLPHTFIMFKLPYWIYGTWLNFFYNAHILRQNLAQPNLIGVISS